MNNRKRVGITDYVRPPFDIEADALGEEYELVDLKGDEARLPEAQLADLDAVIVWHSQINKPAIKCLDACKIVVRYGVGYDNIDIRELESRGIVFCNNPDYGTEEVADTTVAMLLSHLRKVQEYDYLCRHYGQGWQEHTLAPLKRSSQTTIGLIGVGRIGTSVVQRLKPFGFGVLGYDPYQPSGHEKAIGYERVDEIGDLLQRSDAVSLHCPLSTETMGLVDEQFISSMKDGSILVNCARGGLIQSLDPVYAGLRTGKLHAVALDVLPDEPPVTNDFIGSWQAEEPWMRGRITINPHTSYFSDHAWQEMRYKAAETIQLFFESGRTRNRIFEN